MSASGTTEASTEATTEASTEEASGSTEASTEGASGSTRLSEANSQFSNTTIQDTKYPLIFDPDFQTKITRKYENQEFKMKPKGKNVRKLANMLSNAPFEIASHQLFVRNFLSFHSPYRNLLLYHGLGSGKTCSAILVCEEMREYYKLMNIHKPIIVVAAPNIQKEFRKQLFHPNDLVETNGEWKLNTCVGNKLLDEVLGTNHSSEYCKKDTIIEQIKTMIRRTYLFMGYIEFANYIGSIANVDLNDKKNTGPDVRHKLRSEFQKRLIVIDEAQNLRISSSKTGDATKRVIRAIRLLMDNVTRMKLLLLSATPMYNKPREIVDLINIMRLNDERETIPHSQFFDANDEFIQKDGDEVGRELFKAFITGYVSYVKGENPYTFPYRIYPQMFQPENSILLGDFNYKYDVDGRKISREDQVSHIIQSTDIYTNNLSEFQSECYIDKVKDIHEINGSQITKITESAESTGDDAKMQMSFTRIQPLIYLLTVAYPHGDSYKYGPDGLRAVLKENKINRVTRKYEYRPDYDGFFKDESLKKYAGKIHTLIQCIRESTGIVLIYSEYIEGVLIPIALALEEAGITRYASNGNLFETLRSERVHYNGLIPETSFQNDYTDMKLFMPARYAMITGSEYLTNDRSMDMEMNKLTSIRNKNGEVIKVVLISKTGSEGIDFKNIRQIHIMEPWYNIYRIEQIIGRGVRFRSHKNLPFEERNVQIYMHGSVLTKPQIPVDIYIYKIAEKKAIKVSKVTRAVKESAIDCIVNRAQQLENDQELQTEVDIILSSGKHIKYQIGDKKNSLICDYMDTCGYDCDGKDADDYDYGTYEKRHLENTRNAIIERIREIFMTEGYHIQATDMKRLIDARSHYTWERIKDALNYLMDDPNEVIYDQYKRPGKLRRIHDYYLFQPIEMVGYRTREENVVPVSIKPPYVTIPIEKNSSSKSTSISTYETSSSSGSVKKWTRLHKTYDAEKTREFLMNCEDMYNIALNEGNSEHYRKLQKESNPDTLLYSTKWYKTLYELKKNSRLLNNVEDWIVVAHMLDNFSLRQTLHVLQYLEDNKDDSSKFIKELRNQLERRQFNEHIFIYDYKAKPNGIVHVYRKNNGVWSENNIDSSRVITEYNRIINEKIVDGYYGFYGRAANKDEIIFRVINNAQKSKTTGIRVDKGGNTDKLNILKTLISVPNKIPTIDIVVIIEVLLRQRDGETRSFLYPYEKYINEFRINIYKID